MTEYFPVDVVVPFSDFSFADAAVLNAKMINAKKVIASVTVRMRSMIRETD